MASFSSTHPFAYHTFPLTAARSIWTAAALLGKDDQGAKQSRRTGTATDRRLGFSRFVHFYLPRGGARPEALPILGAQLQPARERACPHALIVVPTTALADADCTVCNWNIAVSRPGVAGVAKGGNWTRGTDSERIAGVWETFRATAPDPEKARGFWGEPAVPVVAGAQIAANLRLLRLAPQQTPELLLRSPARIFAGATIVTFSRADLASLQLLGPSPDNATLTLGEFSGYDQAGDPLDPHLREALDEHLAGRRPEPPNIGRRPRPSGRGRASARPCAGGRGRCSRRRGRSDACRLRVVAFVAPTPQHDEHDEHDEAPHTVVFSGQLSTPFSKS